MSAKATTPAPTGRKKLAQGKERSDAALGHDPQMTSSPEGATENGGLPGGWQRVKLGQVADVIMGQAPRGDETNFDQQGTVFVKAGEFGPVRPIVREWTTRPLKFAKSGDVLICVVGATCGKLNLSIDCAIGRSVAALRPSERTFDTFLHFQLMPKVLQLRAGSTGSAQGVLSRDVLAGIDLVLPPLPEQRRIVAEIEKQFTRLEAGVAALRRVQANLKRYRAAVLKAACEGKLVSTEAELHRQRKTKSAPLETGAELLTRILAERRKNWTGRGQYKEPAAPDTAILPPLPEGWTWASLEQLSVSSSYGTSAKCSYENSGPPVLRIPNISSGRIDLADLKFAGSSETIAKGEELRPGDLIIIRTNGSRSLIGRSAVVREKLDRATDYASYLIRFRLVQMPVLFGWVAAIWDSSFLRAWIEQRAATSAGQHNISMSVLATLPLPLSPLDEQTRIVAEVERRLSVVEELESVVSANLSGRSVCGNQSCKRHSQASYQSLRKYVHQGVSRMYFVSAR